MRIKKAFTLIEIMIVVVIIGILAVALVPRLLGAISRTNDQARKAELKQLATVLISYAGHNDGAYPLAAGCVRPDDGVGKILIDAKDITRTGIPLDPNKNNTVPGCDHPSFYYYRPLSFNGIENSSFMLVAKMENGKNGNVQTVPAGSDRESVENSITGEGQYYVELGAL